MSEDNRPVLDTIAVMTAASIAECNLGQASSMLVRLAALVAADAPPLSYLANAGVSSDAGVTLDDVQDVLVAVAPIVGTARVVSAAGKRHTPSASAIAVAEAELDNE